jgi:hypothetical protein
VYMCYPRAERIKQIESVLAVRVVESKPPASMRQIAKAIGMSPSGTLMDILWDMVDAGILVANPRPYRGHIGTAWDFRIPANKIDQAVGMAYEVQK